MSHTSPPLSLLWLYFITIKRRSKELWRIFLYGMPPCFPQEKMREPKARASRKVHTVLHHIEILFQENRRIDPLSAIKRISFTCNKARFKWTDACGITDSELLPDLAVPREMSALTAWLALFSDFIRLCKRWYKTESITGTALALLSPRFWVVPFPLNVHTHFVLLWLSRTHPWLQ